MPTVDSTVSAAPADEAGRAAIYTVLATVLSAPPGPAALDLLRETAAGDGDGHGDGSGDGAGAGGGGGQG